MLPCSDFKMDQHPQLDTTECSCGRMKSKRVSFCYYCFIELPIELSELLHLQFGLGYEEGYLECFEWLKENYYPLINAIISNKS